MGSPSKNKGKSWERDVAKFLTETYGESFVRVFGSGSFTGGINNHRLQTLSMNQIQANKGDISPPETWINFNVECKFYADFPWHQFIQGEPIKQLDLWCAQCLEVAKPEDLTVILIKINRRGSFVVWHRNDLYVSKFSNHGLTYITESQTHWQVQGWDQFWSNNRDAVKSVATGI